MKKVLLASTALMMSAGVAAADGHAGVSLSGSASAILGVLGNGSYTGTDTTIDITALDLYTTATLDVTMVGVSDSGLEFGASMDVSVGTGYDFGDTELDEEDGTFGLGSIYVSGEFGTLTFDADGIDDLYNDDFSHDIMYEYDINGLSFAATYQFVDDGGDDSQFSASLGYEMDAFGITVTGNDGTSSDTGVVVELTYAVSDDISVYIEHDMPNGGADSVTEVGGSFSTGDVTVEANYNTDDEYDVSIAYDDGTVSASASIDEDSTIEVEGGYDLGGGLELVAGFRTVDGGSEDYFVGATMSF